MKPFIVIFFAAIFSGCTTPKTSPEQLAQQVRLNDTLATAESSFAQGEYKVAANTIHGILVRDQQLPVNLRARAYLLKARLESAFARNENMSLWLEKLYLVAPSTKLDPLLDPPPMFNIWNSFSSKQAKLN